jgi:hypothetical protein
MHRYSEGMDGLGAFCDVCDEQIIENGFVVWNSDNLDDWLVIHQGRCDPGHASGYDCSSPLDLEMLYLASDAA